MLPNETRFITMKNSWKIPEGPKLFSSFARRTQALLCVFSEIRRTRFYTHGMDQMHAQEEAFEGNGFRSRSFVVLCVRLFCTQSVIGISVYELGVNLIIRFRKESLIKGLGSS